MIDFRGLLAILAAVALAAIRVAGHKSPAFQAVAHLYTGGLFGAYLRSGYQDRGCLALAVGLTIVETICFFAGRL